MNATQVMLKLLKKFGAETIFITSGTDHAAIIEEYAKGGDYPKLVVVPHEFVAASAAYGYSLAGGLGVAVVHTVPGTANAAGVIMDAYTSMVPLLIIAGRSPYTEFGSPASRDLRVHWTQEARDQGELIRQYVKWDFEIRDPSQMPYALHRALQIATSEPMGPVYLMLPREVTVKEAEYVEYSASATAPGPRPDDVKRFEKLLSESKRPLIVTWRAGRKKEWYDALARFAELHKIPVTNYVGEVVNYPTEGPMASDASPSQADLIISVECEVPWIPKNEKVNAKVVSIGVDPLHSFIPYYGFPCDVCAQTTVDLFFNSVKLEKLNFEWGAEALRVKANPAKGKRITQELLSYEVGRIRKDLDAVILDEYEVDRHAVELKYGEYYADPSLGHLGWALGASAGYRIRSGRHVIAVVGDGGFLFGVPEAFYYIAQAYSQPVLVVIYDNGGWLAVKESVSEVFPDGVAVSKNMFPGAELKRFNIGETVKAFGGDYYLVESGYDLSDVMNRAKLSVLSGRTAVVQAIVGGSKA